MRWCVPLLAARKPQQEPVPYKPTLPLKLNKYVSGKGDKTSEVCCLYEMSVLFACFKTNDFNQKLCSREIENFQKCYTRTMGEKKVKKEREMKGILDPGAKRLSHKQLNILLRNYPNV